MPGEAGARLSGKQALALHMLWERTIPGGMWQMAGYHGARTNTLMSLERKGLARVRLYASLTGHHGYEAQITVEGQAWIEQHPEA